MNFKTLKFNFLDFRIAFLPLSSGPQLNNNSRFGKHHNPTWHDVSLQIKLIETYFPSKIDCCQESYCQLKNTKSYRYELVGHTESTSRYTIAHWFNSFGSSKKVVSLNLLTRSQTTHPYNIQLTPKTEIDIKKMNYFVGAFGTRFIGDFMP